MRQMAGTYGRGGTSRMDEGWPLKRTPLQRRSRLNPGTSLRRAPMPHSRPARRAVTPEERRAKAIVRERSERLCELCGRRGQHASHRLAASQGGPMCPTNLLRMCGRCHLEWVHAEPVKARTGGWALTSGQDPATEPVWLSPAATGHTPGWYLMLPDGGIEPATGCGLPDPALPSWAQATREEESWASNI